VSPERPRIFITQPVAERAIRTLETRAHVSWNHDALHVLSKPELIEAVRDVDYLVCLVQDRVDAEVIAAAERLKAIASMTIVPEDIDVAAATARGIPVTVIPPMVTEATADLTMALLLAVARRVPEADRLVRAGTFPGAQSRHLEGRRVSGATLGIVGCGRVGQAVARRARGFGMRLLYHDPRRLDPADEAALGLEYRQFRGLLGDSDFVSLHVMLTPANRHLIGAAELARMKPTAFLVNASRGPVVDERALVAALVEGRIAGAALDVYEREPRPEPALLTLSNVVMTPHIGSAEVELRERMAAVVVDNLLAVMDGHRPPHCANPEVLRPG
jgi:glyoxylate reductase